MVWHCPCQQWCYYLLELEKGTYMVKPHKCTIYRGQKRVRNKLNPGFWFITWIKVFRYIWKCTMMIHTTKGRLRLILGVMTETVYLEAKIIRARNQHFPDVCTITWVRVCGSLRIHILYWIAGLLLLLFRNGGKWGVLK